MSAVATFETLSLEEAAKAQLEEHPDREVARIQLRRLFDLGAFAAGVHTAPKAGAPLVRERVNTDPGHDGHEELLVVLSGRATFTVDGDEVDAPAGQVVYIRDPGARRSAVAAEDGTSILSVGGRRGEPFRLTPGEAMAEFWPNYRAKDFEAAEAILREVLAEYPGNALLLYNLACTASLLGRPEEALEHLRAAVTAWPGYAENAREDSDLDPIRDDPRFAELVSG